MSRGAAYDPTADIIRPAHVKAATGLSTVTIWRLRRRGLFPNPIQLSPGAVGWKRSTIEAWLGERQQAGR
jgi:prophage regulatory protein